MTPRHDLALPLLLAGLMTGGAVLALLGCNAPRVAIALVILTLAIILAVLREHILGDR